MKKGFDTIPPPTRPPPEYTWILMVCAPVDKDPDDIIVRMEMSKKHLGKLTQKHRFWFVERHVHGMGRYDVEVKNQLTNSYALKVKFVAGSEVAQPSLNLFIVIYGGGGGA